MDKATHAKGYSTPLPAPLTPTIDETAAWWEITGKNTGRTHATNNKEDAQSALESGRFNVRPLYLHPCSETEANEDLTIKGMSLTQAEEYIIQLETENDAEYVGRGADAYDHSCALLEQWQAERSKKHLVEGPEGGLTAWMAWAQEIIEKTPTSEDAYKADTSKRVKPLGWRVREIRYEDGSLKDCFVEAPAAEGMPYACEVLGDDYTGYGDIEAKYEHCKMIVAWANDQPYVPKGWQLVPLKADRKMMDEAKRVEEDGYWAMYEAMLAVAPTYNGEKNG